MLHLGFARLPEPGQLRPGDDRVRALLIPGEDWDALERWWARSVKRVDLAARIRPRLTSSIESAAALLTPGRWVRVAEPGPVVAAVRAGCRPARELTVVMLMGIAGSQLLDENWAAHKVFDHHNPPPVAAAVSYLGMFQGWSMFAPEAPMTDFNLTVDAMTVDGRHVDPYNEVANPKYPHPGFTIPVVAGPELAVLRLRQPHPRIGGAYHQALLEWILRYPQRTGPRQGSDHVVQGVQGRGRQPAAGRADPATCAGTS